MNDTFAKNISDTSISPRLEGYLARARAGLADRTKTPSQHAAAQRVVTAIEGHIKQKQQQE